VRKFAYLLFSVCLTITIATDRVLAATFTLDKTQSGRIVFVRGEAAAPKTGDLIGSNITIAIDGETVELRDLVADGARHAFASGKFFNLHMTNENNEACKLEGFCFFDSGDKLSALLGAGATTSDLLLTTDGQRFAGNIKSVDRDVITILENGITRLVRARDVRSIASGHVFNIAALIFPERGFDSPDVNSFKARILRFDLDPTMDDFMTVSGKKRLEAAIEGAGYNKWERGAILGASVLITGAAIAVPLAVAAPAAGRHVRAQSRTPTRDHIVEIEN
jgi:hypothetical protein